MRKFSVFLGIILFVQILYSCTSPIIPYSIDAKKEDPPLETLINWEGWYTIKAINHFSLLGIIWRMRRYLGVSFLHNIFILVLM